MPVPAAPRASPQPRPLRGCSAELPGSCVSHRNSSMLKKPVRCPACGTYVSNRDSSLQQQERREVQSTIWTLVGNCCWGVSPWGAAPCPLGCTRSLRQCLCCQGWCDCSRSSWSQQASAWLAQPMGGVSGVSQAHAVPRFVVGRCNIHSVSQLHNCHGLSWLD